MQDDALLCFFGTQVQKLRKTKGLSQEKLAELANLDRTYISSVERGQRNISLINIYRLIKALDCKSHDLFPMEGKAS